MAIGEVLEGWKAGRLEDWKAGKAKRLPPDKLVLIAPFWHLPGFLPRLVPILKLVMPMMRPFKDADFSDLEVRAGFERLMPGIDFLREKP